MVVLGNDALVGPEDDLGSVLVYLREGGRKGGRGGGREGGREGGRHGSQDDRLDEESGRSNTKEGRKEGRKGGREGGRAYMQRAEDEDEAGEGRVGGDGLKPVVVDIEEKHLGLRGPGREGGREGEREGRAW